MLFRMLGVPVAILALLSGVLIWQNHVLMSALWQVNRSDQVTSEARRLLRLLSDMDSSVRGYLLTGRPELLGPFNKTGEVGETLNALSELLRDKPESQKQVAAMRSAIADWRTHAESLVALRRRGGDYASYENLVESNRRMDLVRDEREALLSSERLSRDRYAANARMLAKLTDATTIVLSLIAALVVAFITTRQLKNLIRMFGKLLGDSESRANTLRESRNSLYQQAQLLDLAHEPILVRDLNDRIVYWNRSAERVYGWSSIDAIGKTSHELLKTRFPRPLPEILDELKRTGYWHGELIHTARSGSVCVMESRWVLQKDDESKPSAILETNFDVTERKKNEDQLRRMSAIVESSYDAIIGKTTDGTITSWNPGATVLYGYEAEEVIGRPMKVLIPRNHPDEEAGILQRILRGERIEQYETVRQRKDGSTVEVSLRISPIYDSSGNVVGASNISHDITQRRKTERALIQTEKLASVGRMAATMAHEINNPLAAAMNAVYLVGMNPNLPETARRTLEMAEQELARVAHLTKQTLGFYRETGKPTTVRLSEVLDGVLNLYAPRLVNKNIAVKRRFRNDVEIRAVEGEVRQVISNLIANSIDATRTNGVIYVRVATPISGNGRRPMVRLTIADEGEGISRENQRHLFEPFFTTKQAFGTGLGLWVSKELVQKQEGRIRVRSRVGEGTVVAVWLPAERRFQQCSRIA